jgi:hypothetical protein
MSFDPYGYQDSTPPASGGPPGDVPDSPGIQPHLADARERVKLPAVFLIIVGVFNLLVGLVAGGAVAIIGSMPAEQLHGKLLKMYEDVEKQNPNHPIIGPAVKELRNQDPQSFKNSAMIQYGLVSGGWLIAALVVIFGGIRMFQLRSYGICILASIVAAVPCISVTSCCCLGEVIGIWSIVVLLSPHVRMAFR